jgi:hypothetical protein
MGAVRLAYRLRCGLFPTSPPDRITKKLAIFEAAFLFFAHVIHIKQNSDYSTVEAAVFFQHSPPGLEHPGIRTSHPLSKRGRRTT